jgi:single-stranded-DNA-specific exonuclease
MKFRWSMAPPQPLLAGELAKALRVSPLLAQCLLNRGLRDPALIDRFLEPRLKNLADPFLLPNMTRAVERLFAAHRLNELVVVFGDYDVDGVTSTALLLEVLRPLGWKVEYYLPHRIDEGYGLSTDAVENCLKKIPAKLLLAVDCGSTSVETIKMIGNWGVDVIVLDHHQVSDPSPPALALVNPQLGSSSIPKQPPGPSQDGKDFRELCSVGLAFKLAHAILKHGREAGIPGAQEFDLRPLLDLVALGTIADLVPLTGENRILTAAGLSRLRTSKRPGLEALKRVSQCQPNLGVHEVAFQLAPRLNASGRLESAEQSMDLLLAGNPADALSIAQKLDSQNRQRQTIERDISKQVIEAVEAKFKPEVDFVIIEGNSQWHIGVVGIVAARVLQQFYRPTIIFGGDGEHWRGSGRSVPGFDLAEALRNCGDLLVRHGGHAMAAGVTLEPRNLEALCLRLNELARQKFRTQELQPELRLDAEVGLEEITIQSVASLRKLHPLGQGNPALHFVARDMNHHRPLERLGAEKQHVKMWLTDGTTTHEAVWWGAGQESLPVGKFDVAFAPEINQYKGQSSVQLKVLDWRAAGHGLI